MNRWSLALCCSFALWAQSCRRSTPEHLSAHTLAHDGRERSYSVYVPPSFDRSKGAPLVIALHGGGGRGATFDEMTNYQLSRAAERLGWLVVFPDGVDAGWNDGRESRSSRDADRATVDDVGFIAALIDRMEVDYGVDERRVYVTGISNGGFMALRLAIELSPRIAAVAPVTASLGKALEGGTPARPVGVMLVNGTEDPLVPFEGGQVRVLGQDRGEILSTADTVMWWSRHNGCPDKPTITRRADDDPVDGTRVVSSRRYNCNEQTEVTLVRVDGGGHTWPGGKQYLSVEVIGKVSRDIEAATEIFAFFSRHSRTPSP